MRKIFTMFVLLLLSTPSYAVIFGMMVTASIPEAITRQSTSSGSSTDFTSEDHYALSEIETFVQVNMDFLPNDIAAGAGDTISALAVLMEVEDANAFGKKLQANFEVIYPSYDVDYLHVTAAMAKFAQVN